MSIIDTVMEQNSGELNSYDKCKNIIVIQARIASTRLPGKVILDLEGEPLLIRMIERVSRIKTSARIVVATTLGSKDDQIVEICQAHGIEVFRGHSTDLLDRHYKAALYYGADIVAKIPSDCPLIAPAVIDKVFDKFAIGDSDYTSNLHPASYPDGNDIEVMSIAALEVAWRKAELPMEREHTTPYIWDRPKLFRIANVKWSTTGHGTEARDYSMSHRWTIDYAEDYAFVCKVYKELYPFKKDFDLMDILDLLDKKPEIHAINARYAGVNWYRHHLEQLKTISSNQTKLI